MTLLNLLSAVKENEVYLDSINGKLAQLDASFQKFSSDLLSSDLVKFFVDLAIKATDFADSLLDIETSLPKIAGAIAGVVSLMKLNGKFGNIDAEGEDGKNGAGKVNMPSYACCV